MAGHVPPGDERVADGAQQLGQLPCSLAPGPGVPVVVPPVASLAVSATGSMILHLVAGWEQTATLLAAILEWKKRIIK